MSRYVLELEGDFEKGDCEKCFLSYLEPMMEHGEIIGYENICVLWANFDNCPLEEVKQGEWIVCFEDWRSQIAGDKCSVCGYEHYSVLINPYKFCPNCGTPMKGGK